MQNNGHVGRRRVQQDAAGDPELQSRLACELRSAAPESAGDAHRRAGRNALRLGHPRHPPAEPAERAAHKVSRMRQSYHT